MSNLLRTIQQVTRDYVDSISHRLPSIKNGTVTSTSSDGTATVRVDGDTATTASVPSIATVKTGDRVKMVLFNRQLTILGAIQRTDKLDADTFGGQGKSEFMRYLPGSPVGSPINGFDANTVDRGKPSLIPMYNGVNTPSQNAAVLETIPYSTDWVTQYFHETRADGGKLFHRVFHSGTTWSAWEQQLAGIVATGTTGGWDWIKYTDGRAEASIEGTQMFAHTSQSGAMYLDREANRYPFVIALPSGVFVGKPQALGNCMGSTSTFLNLMATTTVVNMYTAAFTARPDNNVQYNIKLEGRWK